MKFVHGIIVFFILCVAGGYAFAERMSVTAPLANIRSGPGTKYKVMWQIGKYHPVDIEEKSGQWYLFRDYEGDKGWVHQSLLGKTDTVITKKEVCNIRPEPGTKNDPVFQVGAGIPFKVLKREDNWIHIRHEDGDKGWIHQSLIW